MKSGKHISILFSTLLIFLFSCSVKRINDAEKNWNAIKESKDYYDFQAFINLYPQSEYFDSALFKYIKTRQEDKEYALVHWDCFRDCVEILLDSNGQITFNDTLTSLTRIAKLSYDFIANKDNQEYLPKKRLLNAFENDKRKYSTGVFIIYSPMLNKDNHLRKLVTNIRQGVGYYKNDLAHEWFNLEYNELVSLNQNIIDTILSKRVNIIAENIFIPPPPPPY